MLFLDLHFEDFRRVEDDFGDVSDVAGCCVFSDLQFISSISGLRGEIEPLPEERGGGEPADE